MWDRAGHGEGRRVTWGIQGPRRILQLLCVCPGSCPDALCGPLRNLEQVRIELVAVPGHKEGMQLEPETEENCQFLGSLAQYNLSAAGPGLEWPAS